VLEADPGREHFHWRRLLTDIDDGTRTTTSALHPAAP
jgi:hypothetical protein